MYVNVTGISTLFPPTTILLFVEFGTLSLRGSSVDTILPLVTILGVLFTPSELYSSYLSCFISPLRSVHLDLTYTELINNLHCSLLMSSTLRTGPEFIVPFSYYYRNCT